MLYLKCAKDGRHYILKESNSDSLQVLYLFLSDDFLSFSEWYKEWLLSDSDGTGGNVSFLDKKDGNVILTLDPVVYGTDTPFIATQKDFLVILNTWEKLCREGWQEIIITQDDSGVHLEGKNNE